MEKNENQKQKIQLIILSAIVVLLIGAIVYLLFFNKKELAKPIDSGGTTENTNGIAKNEYKTADGKFTLKIVDKNDTETIERIKKDYGETLDDSIYKDVKTFGCWSSGEISLFRWIEEDDNYAVYTGDFANHTAQYPYNVMVNKKTGQIVTRINDEAGGIYKYISSGEPGSEYDGYFTFIKTSAGYYFARRLGGEFSDSEVIVYTTKWNELGYVDMENIKSDSKGIYVYSSYDGNSFKLNGNLVKYNAEGSLIDVNFSQKTFSNKNGVGVVEVTGYPITKKAYEVDCEPDDDGQRYNCPMVDYVYFNITKTNNQEFIKFINESKGNLFVGDMSIGIGCIEEKKLIYANSSIAGSKFYQLTENSTNKILSATKERPVTLKMEKLKLEEATGASTMCYSHMTYIKVID